MKRRSKKAKIKRKKKKATLTRRKTRRNSTRRKMTRKITRRKMTRKITPRKKRPKRNRKRRMQTRARPTIMLKMTRRHAKGKRLLASRSIRFLRLFTRYVCSDCWLYILVAFFLEPRYLIECFFGCFCVMNNTAALY